MDEPFSVALRVSLEVAESGTDALIGPGWRERLRLVGVRELGSRIWPDDSRPDRRDADRIVAQTFRNHPMVNLTASRGRNLSDSPHALVIAEIVLRPELAPISPGGAYPDVTDELLSEPLPIHATVWSYAVGSDDERAACAELVQQVVTGLSPDLWRQDG
jgi:hypothetical protein